MDSTDYKDRAKVLRIETQTVRRLETQQILTIETLAISTKLRDTIDTYNIAGRQEKSIDQRLHCEPFDWSVFVITEAVVVIGEEVSS